MLRVGLTDNCVDCILSGAPCKSEEETGAFIVDAIDLDRKEKERKEKKIMGEQKIWLKSREHKYFSQQDKLFSNTYGVER